MPTPVNTNMAHFHLNGLMVTHYSEDQLIALMDQAGSAGERLTKKNHHNNSL